jgi:hypothetical protein
LTVDTMRYRLVLAMSKTSSSVMSELQETLGDDSDAFGIETTV